tara:strand:- start:4008 stop:4259 length:252 start_codon:yes stop_codon:yes gene_type:complete
MILKKGTDCRLSEVGYNNFYYPSKKRLIRVLNDSVVTKMSWVDFNSGLVPVKIKNSDLVFGHNNNDDDDKPFSVVWVKSTDLF